MNRHTAEKQNLEKETKDFGIKGIFGHTKNYFKLKSY
jgi:hypothetical protein